MSMHWPQSLVTELAHRRCIIFLGSGVSAGSYNADRTKKPPTWEAFLRKMIKLLNAQDLDFATIEDLLMKEKYLDAAEVIYELAPKADYHNLIRQEFEVPKFEPSKMHEIILKLDPKIVITTNYDRIYDNFCTTGPAVEGYNVAKYYEEHLIDNLRSPLRVIIKAHGCVSDPKKIVLTKSQYFRARKDYGNFYKLLDALFLTHTILFLGYSLNDPDIQLILENANITAPSDHTHYFVTGNNLNEVLKNASKNAYNLTFIEYQAGDYTSLNLGLEDLLNNVLGVRESNPL